MMDVFDELADIGRMLDAANTIIAVRREVSKVMLNGFIVTDGKHCEGVENCDVIIRCGKDSERVARRLREKMPDMKIAKIAEGILGVKKNKAS